MKTFQYSKQLYKGFIYFAVNIDMVNWDPELSLLSENLPE